MATFPVYHGGHLIPGIQTTLETSENQFWYGHWTNQKWFNGTIASTAVDAGNTDTKILREGLLVGQIASNGKIKEWNPTGTDGSQFIYGILGAVHTTSAGTDQFVGRIMVGGNVKAGKLLVPGEASYGISGTDEEYLVNIQMSKGGRFLLDTDLAGTFLMDDVYVSPSAAQYTAGIVNLEVADHGKTWLVDGGTGMTFNLPAAQVGLVYRFYNMVAQDLVLDGDASETFTAIGYPNTAVTITFDDSANPADGAACEVYCNTAGEWLFRQFSTNVPTVA